MKEKKAPKRGLGIAKLEEIRMAEEEKKKSLVSLSLNHSDITNSASSSSSLALLQKSPSPPPTHDPPSPISLSRRTTIPSLNSNSSNPNPAVGLPSLNSGYGHMGFSRGHVGVETYPKVCSYGEFGRDNNGVFRLDHRQPNNNHPGFVCRSISSDFPPAPNPLRGCQRFPQQSSASSGVPISPSSVLNYLAEKPFKNHLRTGGSAYNKALLTEDEKKMAVGMKRPYPFAMQSPPGPAYDPCSCVFCVPKSEKSTRWISNTSARDHTDLAGYHVKREGEVLRRSTVQSEPNHSDIKLTENRMLNGDFLTLAPPPRPSLATANSGPITQIDDGKGSFHGQVPPCESSMQQPLLKLFPEPAENEIGQVVQRSSSYKCGGEDGEKVDLRLKL
ncbi:OLC1v1008237C1 [Oldenlandia corymbosa var. corymbosa]|uniref:OLC1v1008237C1 n=1 Tax=Oldenlandia corymbosa var. corymbosa TaxID=529605 RepID=A0AAV1DL32_OLDCO|nr:OLC1v1008237C1 [Oldenlandia corymbosa var. corymbosa]